MTGKFGEQRSGRSATILSAANVQMHGSPVVIGGAAGHSDEPQIRLHRSGSTVTQIEVVCRCGEQILLDCDYADN
ncbi:MAG: hypothetical protein ACF8TS_11790 [Maioricimonas sp. JB049]